MTTFHRFEVIRIDESKVREKHQGFDAILALSRVYDLHKPVVGPYDKYICEHCSSFASRYFINYPCYTIVAIEGE